MTADYHLSVEHVNTKVFHARDLLPAMKETIGERLKRLRVAKELTQGALAKFADIGQSAIGNIEADTRGYGASVVPIAKALDTNPDYLQLKSNDPRPHPPPAVPPLRPQESAGGIWPFKSVSSHQYALLSAEEQKHLEDGILLIVRPRQALNHAPKPLAHIRKPNDSDAHRLKTKPNKRFAT